jgi:hypothetical protein
VQNLVPASQISTAIAIVLFCQQMGSTVALPATNAIFSNTLRKQLQERIEVIGVDPDVIVNAGVRSIRELVSGDQLTATLQSYSNSVDFVMYLGIAVAIAAFGFAWGLGFKDIRKERELRALRSSETDSDWRACASQTLGTLCYSTEHLQLRHNTKLKLS